MPAPIMPAPRTATLRTGRSGRPWAVGAGVDGLEVEEERLDHVLGDLAGDQLGEIPGLDGQGGLEVDLGALDGRREDVARAGMGAPAICFFRLAGNAGRLAANLGFDGVPPGILYPLTSQGCWDSGWASMKARAFSSISSRVAATSWTRPFSSAARGVLGALEEHLEQGVGDAHEAYGPGDAAARREQAEGDLGQADAGARGVEGDAVVGGERDLVTAAEGRAVDGGDDGLAEGLDAAQRVLDRGAGLEGGLGVLRADLDHFLEVAAGEEGLLGGGVDDPADGVLLGLGAVRDGGDGVLERLVHRVGGLVRVVEDEGDDAGLVLFPADGRALGHVGFFSVSRGGPGRIRCVRRRSRRPCRRRRRG